jgi:photosystem II stability/assembly factor-like uncharacterized protein
MNIVKVYKSLSASLFYLTIVIILAGINFSDGRSPGWFVQTLPINDAYNDLFFIDTLHGWMVSTGYSGTSDTGYIIHTSNGGYNWVVQKAEPQLFWRVQFVDTNYGYVVGGYPSPCIKKTTNGGIIWTDISSNIGNLFTINDISFVNKDTGWVCINDFFDGGIYKTMNGGNNWTQQKYDQYAYKVFFINKDTGWYCTGSNQKLYRTTNSGANWSLQYTNPSYSITDIFFLNSFKGWMFAGYIKYTTDGGFTWTIGQSDYVGYSLKFLNENTGYGGVFGLPPKIIKTIDGGLHWGYQVTPYTSDNLIAPLRNDTSNAWSGQLMRTTDGGGPIIFTDIQQISTNVPDKFKLEQNYPNPFNSMTNIKFQIIKTEKGKWKKMNGIISLKVFDITGKEIENLIHSKLEPGTYEVKFDAGKLSSGLYFYSFFADGMRVDTKKMILIK